MLPAKAALCEGPFHRSLLEADIGADEQGFDTPYGLSCDQKRLSKINLLMKISRFGNNLHVAGMPHDANLTRYGVCRVVTACRDFR